MGGDFDVGLANAVNGIDRSLYGQTNLGSCVITGPPNRFIDIAFHGFDSGMRGGWGWRLWVGVAVGNG